MTDKDILMLLQCRGFRYDKKGRAYYFCPDRRNGQHLVSMVKLKKIAKENNIDITNAIRPY